MWRRRNFIKLLGTATLGSLTGHTTGVAQTTLPDEGIKPREYGAADFSGWQVVLGDGLYAPPGVLPPDDNDIATLHYGSHSELLANVERRRIMAHNVTYTSIVDDSAFEFVHTCGYKFRLPYLPATTNVELNAQTIEGGLFIWDGGGTRLDYGLAFQWILNPWVDDFGAIMCWTDLKGGQWTPSGHLGVDKVWHTVEFTCDFSRETTSLRIDGAHYPIRFTATPKSEEKWGTETAARLQAEIISIYPGEEGNGALHEAEFRDWFWHWEPANTCRLFLPLIQR